MDEASLPPAILAYASVAREETGSRVSYNIDCEERARIYANRLQFSLT